MVINLNNKLNNILKSINLNNKPNLFLHVCCAPCSSAVLEKLHEYFQIFIIYYNPNIDTNNEFNHRFSELEKLLEICNYNDIKILYNNYNHNEFLNYIKGYEKEPELGKRCELCYKLRLKFSYDFALDYIKNNNMLNNTNYLCTTLSISPHKNATLLESIGEEYCKNDILIYLPSDFKKENGYLNSIILSKKYNLYRQEYCGCEFAKSHLNSKNINKSL